MELNVIGPQAEIGSKILFRLYCFTLQVNLATWMRLGYNPAQLFPFHWCLWHREEYNHEN